MGAQEEGMSPVGVLLLFFSFFSFSFFFGAHAKTIDVHETTRNALRLCRRLVRAVAVMICLHNFD